MNIDDIKKLFEVAENIDHKKDDLYKQDFAEAVKAIQEDKSNLFMIDKKFLYDLDFCREVVVLRPELFEFFPVAVRNDYDLVSEVVSKNGILLKSVDVGYSFNKDIVLSAVKSDGLAFEYASKELMKDREVIDEAVKQNGYVYKYLRKEDKELRSILLSAIETCPKAIKYASDKLKNDLFVVGKIALNSDVENLKYAGSSILNNKEFAMEVIKEKPEAFFYFSDELKKDFDVALVAVKGDNSNIFNVLGDIRFDKELLMTCSEHIKSLDDDDFDEVSDFKQAINQYEREDNLLKKMSERNELFPKPSPYQIPKRKI